MSPFDNGSKQRLVTILVVLGILLLASLFLFPSFRHFLSSRVLPIPPITETMVGGRLLATPAPGPHTLTYEARTSSGVTLTDSVTFTQPAPVCNNNIVEPGEACDAPDLTQPLGATNPGLLQDYCSQRCQVELDVTEYGAIANDNTDDTLLIQNALNSAKGLLPNTTNSDIFKRIAPGTTPVKTPPTFNPPDTLVTTAYFPAGTYDIIEIHPWWGTTLLGDGPTTILKRLPGRVNWERMVNTSRLHTWATYRYNYYGGTTDSPLLTIKGFTIDGNGRNQDPRLVGADTEHQENMYIGVYENPAFPGRIKAHVEDIVFTEAAAGGLYIYNNADVTAKNLTCHNNYKCLVFTGGHSKINIDTVNVSNDPSWPGPGEGSNPNSSIDSEVLNGGYGGSYRIDVNLKGIHDNAGGHGFQLGLLDGSTFVADDIYSSYPQTNIASDGRGTISVSNASFVVGQDARANRILKPGNLTFTNTIFTASELDQEYHTSSKGPIALPIDWGGAGYNNQTVKCVNCTFTADSTMDATDFPTAIMTALDDKDNGNQLIVEGGTVTNKMKYGFVMNQRGTSSPVGGGTWRITGTQFESTSTDIQLRDREYPLGTWNYWNVVLTGLQPAAGTPGGYTWTRSDNPPKPENILQVNP